MKTLTRSLLIKIGLIVLFGLSNAWAVKLYTVYSSPLPKQDNLNCYNNPNYNSQFSVICNSQDYEFQISFERVVDIIFPAGPGYTGHAESLTFNPSMSTRQQGSMNPGVYTNGKYRVDITTLGGVTIILYLPNTKSPIVFKYNMR